MKEIQEKIKKRINQIALEKSASPSDWGWIEQYMIEGAKIAQEELTHPQPSGKSAEERKLNSITEKEENELSEILNIHIVDHFAKAWDDKTTYKIDLHSAVELVDWLREKGFVKPIAQQQPKPLTDEEINHCSDIYIKESHQIFTRSKKSFLEGMKKANELIFKNERKPLTNAVEFAEWLNNNFYIPTENGMWRIMVEHIEYQGKKPKVNVFSTEELYELFQKSKTK